MLNWFNLVINNEAPETEISLDMWAFFKSNISQNGIVNLQDATVPFGITMSRAIIVVFPSSVKFIFPLICAEIPVCFRIIFSIFGLRKLRLIIGGTIITVKTRVAIINMQNHTNLLLNEFFDAMILFPCIFIIIDYISICE